MVMMMMVRNFFNITDSKNNDYSVILIFVFLSPGLDKKSGSNQRNLGIRISVILSSVVLVVCVAALIFVRELVVNYNWNKKHSGNWTIFSQMKGHSDTQWQKADTSWGVSGHFARMLHIFSSQYFVLFIYFFVYLWNGAVYKSHVLVFCQIFKH